MAREELIFIVVMFFVLLEICMPSIRKKRKKTDHDAVVTSGRKVKRKLKKYAHEEKLIFTKNIQIPITDSSLVSNRFALLIAGSGSGKSDSVIKNNIITCPSADKLITDVGGVLFDEFEGYLESCDYEVSYLDLLNFKDTYQFNPLRYIRARGPNDSSFSHYVADVKVGYDEELDIDFIDNVICKALIPKNEKDDFWNKLTRDLLSLLIQILIYLPDEYYQKNRNLSTAVNLFSQIFEPGEEENTTKLDDIVAVLESELSDYVLGEDGKRYLQLNMELPASSVVLSYRSIRSQLSGSGDFSSSMRGSFSTYLSIFNKPNIIRLTKSDNLRLDKLGIGDKKKKVIFVQTNEAEAGYMQIVSLFYSVVFNMIIYNSTRNQSNRLDSNVLLILEEAGNYQIPNLAKILATTRKRGASAIIAIQSVSQLNELYGKNGTETIISNCAIKQYISGTTSTSNIELLQKLGGETKYQMEGLSSSNGRSSGRSLSETYHSLLTANFINSLPKFHSIVILGTDVYEDKNMYYKEMTEWKNYKETQSLERRTGNMDIEDALEKKGITEEVIDDSNFGEPDSVDVITYDDIKDIVKGGVDHGENEQDKAGVDRRI